MLKKMLKKSRKRFLARKFPENFLQTEHRPSLGRERMLRHPKAGGDLFYPPSHWQ
jgi:hypothetical protein